jgi:hypothetical protein
LTKTGLTKTGETKTGLTKTGETKGRVAGVSDATPKIKDSRRAMPRACRDPKPAAAAPVDNRAVGITHGSHPEVR